MRFPPVRCAAVLAVMLMWVAALDPPAGAEERASGWTAKALVTSRQARVVAAHPAALDADTATFGGADSRREGVARGN